MLIVSNKSSKEFLEFLKTKNIDYLKTIDNPNIDKKLADHPDLSIFKINSSTLIVDESVYPYYKKNLKNVSIIKGERAGKLYPYDAIYNIVRFKNFYIHNNFTEKNIKEYFSANNISHIFVKQGYTRCSSLVLKEKILTSDYGIYKKLKNVVDVRLLKEEKIYLEGFEKGFLGGCFGIVKNNTIIFNGDIKKLNSYDIISKEANNEGLDILYPKTDLKDTGSLIYVD